MTLLDFYDLEKAPFHITPDPEFIILSSSHQEALATIIYGIKERKGIITIIGEVGLGKTVTIHLYLDQIGNGTIKAVYLPANANTSLKEVIIKIHDEIQIDLPQDNTSDMINHLEHVLIDEHKKGNTIALILDEAQSLTMETLTDLQAISNLETAKEKLIQIVLSGQPELEQKLNLHELRRLKQCIAMRTTISPLTPEESMTYIQHRLTKVALSQAPVFTKGALKRITKQAAGIPRTINILCDNALITGFGYQRKPISAKIVREVIADFKVKSTRLRFWRRHVFSAAALVLLAVLVALSPYRHWVLAPTEPLRVLQARALKFFQADHRVRIDEKTPGVVPFLSDKKTPEVAPALRDAKTDDKTPEVAPTLEATSVPAPSAASAILTWEPMILEKNEPTIRGGHPVESPVRKGKTP